MHGFLGFDNAEFVTGTSSDIYNEGGVDLAVMMTKNDIPLIPSNTTDDVELVALLTEAVTEYFSAVSSTNLTVDCPAAYDPNPFYQYNAVSSPFAQAARIAVVDGGENRENIPLYPLNSEETKWRRYLCHRFRQPRHRKQTAQWHCTRRDV
jgi:lysophospholipase